MPLNALYVSKSMVKTPRRVDSCCEMAPKTVFLRQVVITGSVARVGLKFTGEETAGAPSVESWFVNGFTTPLSVHPTHPNAITVDSMKAFQAPWSPYQASIKTPFPSDNLLQRNFLSEPSDDPLPPHHPPVPSAPRLAPPRPPVRIFNRFKRF